MPDFVITRDRDARAAVRGYVYQVDLTIDRWLRLQPGSILELERGEDIDLVTQSLAASPDQYARLLEQVKHREVRVSLRSPSAIAALANAVEHRKSNPGITLVFRYTTNAAITGERVSLFKPTAPAITLWESLRNNRTASADQAQHLKEIRAILKSATRPGELNRATWDVFRQFVDRSGEDQLLDLVRRFEWSTGSLEAEQLEPHIRQLIITSGHASDETAAKELYQRLFLFVFKLLTQKGLKRLTPDDIHRQVSLPALAEGDRLLLSALTTRLDELEARLSSIERRVVQQSVAIAGVQSRVKAITRAQGVQAAVDFTTVNPILDVPPPVSCLSRRTETVRAVSEHLKTHAWLALTGGEGEGKTQVCLLVATNYRNCCAWMRCRDLTPEQCYSRFAEMYQALTGLPFNPTSTSWATTLATSIEAGSMLVLDDIPELSGEDEFSHCLMAVAREFHVNGRRLISTSHHGLPSRVRDAMSSLVMCINCPPLQDAEASEILAAYGAPNTLLTNQFVGYVNNLAKRNPTVLAAAADYLAKKDWKFTDAEFTALLKGQHTQGIQADVLSRLLRTFEEDSRELLYRLNVTWGAFSFEDVDLLANVEPTVARAREILHKLTGRWLQLDTDHTFLVSPLIRTLGDAMLDETTRHRCHFAMGMRIMRRRAVGPSEVLEAFTHFVQAKDTPRAAGVMLLALHSMQSLDKIRDDYGLLSIWTNKQLSTEIDLGVRISLRASQIVLLRRVKKQTGFLVRDLDALITEAKEPQGWAVLIAAVTLNPTLSTDDPVRANRYLLTGLKLSPEMLGPDGTEIELPKGVRREQLLWGNAEGIKTRSELRDWMNTVEQLTTEQRENVFAGTDGEDGSITLADAVWLQESNKPKEEQQWTQVRESLDELADWSRRLHLEILWACATRAKMIVEGEYRGSLENAKVLAEAAASPSPADPRVSFVIKHTLGMQYWYAGQASSALLWLDAAQAEDASAFPLLRLDGFLTASLAVGDSDAQRAVRYAETGAEHAKSAKLPKGRIVRALGELAIAQWLAGRSFASVFSTFDEAAEILLGAKRDTSLWKQLFVIFAHAVGYLNYIAPGRESPPESPSGEQYAAPKRGAFLNYETALAKLYDPAKETYLTVLLAMFADSVKNDEKAVAWALQGIDAARVRKQHLAVPIFGYVLIPDLLRNNRYTEALDLALEAAAIFIAHSIGQQTGGGESDIGLGELDLGSILGQKPNDSWRRTEELSLNLALLPAAFRIASVSQTDPEAARRGAEEVADACRKIGTTAADKELWTGAADVVELAFIHRISGRDLIQMVNTFQHEALRPIAYVGASLRNDVPLQSVCEAHLVAAHHAYDKLGSRFLIYRQIVLPFITDYWLKALRDRHSSSIPPSPLLGMLKVVPCVPEEKRAQAVLALAAKDLRADTSPSQREWLMEGVLAMQPAARAAAAS